MKKYILLLCAAAALAACSEDAETAVGGQEPVVPDGSGTPISFSGGIPADAPSTKAEFTDNGPVKITWTPNEDFIGIFGKAGGASIGDNVQYMAVPGADDPSSCTFEAQGTELTWRAGAGTHTFYAYYPYVRMRNPNVSSILAEVPADQTQTGGDMSHIAATAFMVADVADTDETKGSVNLTFTHIFGVMQFVLDAETPMTLAGLTMTSTAADLAGAAAADLTQPYGSCITSVSGGSQSIALDFGAAGLALGDGTPKSAYMLVLPGAHPAGSISLTFETADGSTFTKNIWKTTDVTFAANVKSKQAIKPLTEADFATALSLSVVSVSAPEAGTPFGFGAPVINGADVAIPLTTADASGKSLEPNGIVPVTVTYKIGSESSNRTLNFAHVRDVQTITVSGIQYRVRLSYNPQLPNSGFEQAWTRDADDKYDIPTFWGTGNFFTNLPLFGSITVPVTNANTTKATGVIPGSQPFVESGLAANLKTSSISGVAAAGSLFLGKITPPASLGDASATRKLISMGIPFQTSGKLLGLKADVKYKSGGNTKDGTYDMGSMVVELLKNIDESKPFEYHAYGTEGKGPGVDPNVTDDGYGSTARRAAYGALYLSDKATSFTIKYPSGDVVCSATVIPADTWTEVYIPIDYPDGAEADYDHFNISCSSSARGDQTQAAAGSSLTIDNIRLVYE